MLKNLSIVYLYSNSLIGEIPSLVEALNLTEIDLSQNNLVGKIPKVNSVGFVQEQFVRRDSTKHRKS